MFVLGQGKWTKIMCNCPSYSAGFVQQSPHMGTTERMGKYRKRSGLRSPETCSNVWTGENSALYETPP